MNSQHIPLTGPSIHNMTPIAYRDYVKNLRTEYLARMEVKKEEARVRNKKPGTSPVPDISYRTNDKGTMILTVRNRKPKWITREEITILADFHKVTVREMWNLCISKGVTIKSNMIMVGK